MSLDANTTSAVDGFDLGSVPSTWDSIWRQTNPYTLYQRRIYKITDKIENWKNFGVDFSNKIILDAGCGDGMALRCLQKECQTTGYGIDISGEAIERAIACEQTNQNKYQIGDVRILPFENKMFDIVLCWGVLPYFDEDYLALSEAFRVLKPGGLLLIVQPNLLSFGPIQELYLKMRKKWPYGKHTKRSPFALARIMKRCGFHSVKNFTKPPYTDMPVARKLDGLINRVLPFWGHYLYVAAKK